MPIVPLKILYNLFFRMNSPLTKHYSYYNIDRSSSELADVDNLNKNEKFNFQDKIYWQSASGIYPILNLGELSEFSRHSR